VAVFEAGNGLKRRAMKSKNINVSDSAEQANETAYRERERLSGADLGKTRGGFFAIHATTEAIDAVAKAIATICSATELEILGL
jgi:hypothetical protein